MTNSLTHPESETDRGAKTDSDGGANRGADWSADRDAMLRIIAASAAVIAVLAGVAAAKIAGGIVAPTVLASLLAITLTPLVGAIERQGVPVTLASGAVVVCGLVSVVGGAYLLAPSAEVWRAKAPWVIRSMERQFRNIEREISKSVDKATAGHGPKIDGQASPTDAVIESGQRLIADAILNAPELLLTLLYVAFLCFFLLAERAALHRFVLRIAASRHRTRLRLSRAMLDMRHSVGQYLLTITIINIGLGAAAAVAFWLFGLPNPTLWGALVALLNFMPYIGPMIANLVVFAVGVTVFNDVAAALYPVATLAVLNVFEGQFVTPVAVGRRSQVGPLSVFVALAFGAWLWGALGALVAAPLLIVANSFVRRMVIEEPELGAEPRGDGSEATA